MGQDALSRREAARLAGMAALAGAGLANAQRARRNAVTLGMSTAQFRQQTNAELAKLLGGEGIRTIQLFLTQTDSNYWKYNSRSDLTGLTPERMEAIASAYRSEGISIDSIGVYANLIHPDPSERSANLRYFEAMMKLGAGVGVRTFVTEAGHYQAEGAASREQHHWQEQTWRTVVDTVKGLARAAESHNAVVLLEPYFQGFLATAKRVRTFLEAVGSPRIRTLLDPANLLEVNDLEEMFLQLGPWIEAFHAKDRKLHVTRGVAAGEGDLDYRKFLLLVTEYKPHAPIIVEYVGADTFRGALAYVRRAIREAGLVEG